MKAVHALALCGLAGWLASGCSSVYPPHSGASPQNASVARASAARPEQIPPGSPDAFAHFAAGVSLELNDDEDHAITQFYDSALADPGNQSLVLELSQRYLRSHEPAKAAALLSKAAARSDVSCQELSWLARAYYQSRDQQSPRHRPRGHRKRSVGCRRLSKRARNLASGSVNVGRGRAAGLARGRQKRQTRT